MLRALVILLSSCLAFVTLAEAQVPSGEMIEAAKKEGTLLWYTGMNLADAGSLSELFQRRYPFLKVQIHRASGTQIVSKILVEKNAGKPQFDVASSGVLRVLSGKECCNRTCRLRSRALVPVSGCGGILVRVLCHILRRGLQPKNVVS